MKQNYFAMKAMFASEEYEAVKAKLAQALRLRVPYDKLGALIEQHDRLAIEARAFDRIARSRITN